MAVEIPEKMRDRVEPRRSLPAFVNAPTEKSAVRELARIAKAYVKKSGWNNNSPKDVFFAGLDVSGTAALRKRRREAHDLLCAPTLEAIRDANIEALAVAERMSHHALHDAAIALPVAVARSTADAVSVMSQSLTLDLESKGGFTTCVFVVPSDKPSRWAADWAPLRHIVCAAPNDEYEKAKKVAVALRKKLPLALRARIAYAFPDEPWGSDDLRALFRDKDMLSEPWSADYLLSATTDLDLIRRYLALPGQNEQVIDHAFTFATIFPEKDVLDLLEPLLPELLKKPKYGPLLKGPPRAVAEAIALYRSKRAQDILAGYRGHAILGAIVAAYFQTRSKAAEDRSVVTGPIAKDTDLPAILRDRPWLPAKGAAAPVVKRLSIPKDAPEHIELTEAERHQRLEEARNARPMTAAELRKWRADVKNGDYACADYEYHYRKGGRGVEYMRVPDEEGLAAWNAGKAWVQGTYVEFLARHGTRAIPGFAREDWAAGISTQEVGDEPYLEVLAHIVSPRIAPAFARIAARRKNFRKPALAWLVAHAETAALGLIPTALGDPGESRDDAEIVLTWMAQKGARDTVLSVAKRYGASAEMEELLARDPLAIGKTPPKLPSFLRLADLPPVRLANGAHLPDAAMLALLEMIRVAPLDPPYPGIALVREACDAASLGALSRELIEQWVLAGHPGRFEWMPFSAAMFPEDETTARVAQLARDWARRDKKGAQRLCAVLSTIGSDIALLHLGHIAETSRFADLRDAARAMFDEAAAARGLPRDELEDRIVPDVPFDERSFDTQRQLRRFERAMTTGRVWTVTDFHERVIGHGLLRQLAQRLVWEQGATSFRVSEDGGFADVHDAPFTPDQVPVRLLHPARLTEGERRAWIALFADYRIIQPFEQLARGVAAPAETERSERRITRGTIKVAAAKALGTLESRGWRRDNRGHVMAYLRPLLAGGEARMPLDPGISMEDLRHAGDQTVTGVELPVDAGRLDVVDFSEIVRDLEALRT